MRHVHRRAQRPARAAGLLAALCAVLAPAASAGDRLRLKVDTVRLASPGGGSVGAFETVLLRQSYSNPVVLVWPTNQNTDPSSVRVRNVGASSFEVAVSEPPNNFGGSAGVSAMSLDYLVIEAGVYTLGGTQLEVGTLSTTVQQGGALPGGANVGWIDLNFAHSYASSPVVLTQVQSANSEPGLSPGLPSDPFLEVAVRNVTAADADIALERAQTQNNSVSSNETIGYLAIEAGVVDAFTGSAGSVSFQSIRTANSVSDNCFSQTYSGALGANPLAVASQATRNGGDGGWVQRCNLGAAGSIGLEIDEDQDLDADRAHTNEQISLLLFSQAFDADVGGVRLEAGRLTTSPALTASLAFTTVAFAKPFVATPLIFALPTDEGANPAALRLRNVTTSGFDIAQVYPQGSTGPVAAMSVDYIAVAPGQHRLPGGIELEAGAITTSAFQANPAAGSSWARINYLTPFAAPPAVLLNVQSSNSEPGLDPGSPSIPWLVAAANNNSASGIDVALERAEATAGTTVSESIGYLALPNATQNTFLDDAGNTIAYTAQLTGDAFDGWTDGCDSAAYPAPFSATPRAVAHQATRNGNNGGWLRRCAISSNSIGLTVDEDTAADSERAHIAESASIVAFSAAFEACLEPELSVVKQSFVEYDPVNCTPSTRVCTDPPKRIPGSEQRYTLTVINSRSGASTPDSFEIVDPLPDDVDLFVGDLDGAGAPFVVLDGNDGAAADSEDSGLSFSFAGLSSAADSVAFSTDGSNFGYVPTPNADGFDSNVRFVRFEPSGRMLPANTGVEPQFALQFRVRLR